eukprot:6211203-Pleurochrysis_carterae.AAC.3
MRSQLWNASFCADMECEDASASAWVVVDDKTATRSDWESRSHAVIAYSSFRGFSGGRFGFF